MIASPVPPSRNALRVRFITCVVVVAASFGAITTRLVWLQLVRGSQYRYLSENNRIRLERFPAPRGMIFDRNGQVLADVQAQFDAVAIPVEIPPARRSAVCAELSRTLLLPLEEVTQRLEGPGPPVWKSRLLKRQIGREEMAQLEAHRLELPGVLVLPSPVRTYPCGTLMGPALGHVGEVSPRELALPAYAEYEAGDYLGRGGLEWAWEGRVRGEAGGEQVEVDVQGRRLRVLVERPPRPGYSLVLAIDWRLQEAAERALGNETGAVVALDVRTGDVLALASMPGFDPNLFAGSVTPEAWAALSTDPRKPLQNRAIQGLYPPGSTFKIAMALAGLEQGLITARSRVTCAGELRFGGRAYRCWKGSGHGSVDLMEAMAQSCDVYFYQLGIALGIDAIQAGASQLGLGAPTGIDLPGERSGLLPSKAWKRAVRKQPWYPGETLSAAIGQGYVLATPLQLAVMAAAVANPNGARMLPRLVTRIEDAEGRALEEIPPKEVGRLPFLGTQLALVRQALRQVVASPWGTGRDAEIVGYPVAGKTGTSQVVGMRSEAGPEEWMPWEKRDHALFVCYAPENDPRIAVAVVVEHGGHGGTTAAPVARAVIQAYRALRASPPEGAVAAQGVSR
ncbi:MAG: penicillin-binding protein 2 [Deltaproteobacteria bacterium]|nr:penicillin-binding protein 2 [Deltaproteobacteria bacterium]